jgi:predicted TIM-barrel fold metal-dependent hydrolase
MTDDGRAVVDAHIHQWDPFTTPRVVSGVAKILRRAPFLLPALARIFPRSSREFVGDPRYLLNAYLPGDYRADASPARVGTVVHIEAVWKTKTPIGSVAETHWVARGAGRPLRRRPDAR